MNEVTVNKVEKMTNYEMIDYQLKVLKKLQKETKELLENQQSIQNLHQFEIINLKEKEMNEMINQIGKINQKVIYPKYCQLIEMNFKNNNDVYCNDILKFKIQLKDYNNEIIQLDDKLLKSYSLQCYLKEVDNDNKLIELQKEINDNDYNIEMTIPEIENDKKVELFILINNYQITKLSLIIIVTKYKWDNNYLTNAQLLNGNKSIKKIIGNCWNSYKLTPIIKLTNNIQEFKFKIDKESNCTWIGICDLTNQFNYNYLIGYNNGNNLEYSLGSHSNLSYIDNYNAAKEIKRFDNIEFGTGDTIIIQLKRGQFILINETRYNNQPCIRNIPQQMESVHLAVSLYQVNSQITLLN
ncbi:hypothetical protein ABK040_011265 [Willaertia magna]